MNERLEAEEFIGGFIVEAEEHLTSATANLLAIEPLVLKRQSTPRQVRELFRSLHTIKGLAAMVGVEPIVDIAHAMETILREADRAAGRLPAGSVELLLAGTRAIEQRVQALAKRKTIAAAPVKLVEALTALRSEEAPRPGQSASVTLPADLAARVGPAEDEQLLQGLNAGRRAWIVEFVPSPERAAAGISITSVRERMAELAEIVKVIPRSVTASGAAPGGLAFALIVLTERSGDEIAAAAHADPRSLLALAAAGASEATSGAIADLAAAGAAALDAGTGPEAAFDDDTAFDPVVDHLRRRSFVRVDVARLDDALERLSALVVTRFRLARAVAELGAQGAEVRALTRIVAENGRQLRDLRASIMRARMVSMSELLERVPLIVRGLNRSTGKNVELAIDAGRAELDKAVAERIFPAIVHLIRNAVDHAIEPPAERVRTGKPEAGRIRVSCFERSDSQVELVVSDDGRGIDRVAVAARAGEPVPETDEALLALLARPGFSTRTEVTTTSGRGVGMDVVKRIAVDELGGELSLSTALGAGTTFTMRLPLSITIVDAFTFVCAAETFVVPVSMVEEIQEVDAARVVRGPDRRKVPRGPDRRAVSRATVMLQRRGEAVPLIRLDELFGLVPVREGEDGGAPDAGDAGDGAATGGAGRRRKAIVVRRHGEPFAFAVDRMIGQQEVVVRPLEDRLVRVDGIAGTTDLGDGRPTLVLDLAALGGRMLSESSPLSLSRAFA